MKRISIKFFLLSLFAALLATTSFASEPVSHVIHISVDALGAKYLEKFLEESPDEFANFKQLIDEGSSTMNARTDYFRTTTIQNHTSMVTGRPVETPKGLEAAKGHHMLYNYTAGEKKKGLEPPESLHAVNPEGKYTYSTFDVAHDKGLTTALFSPQAKFGVYSLSYGSDYGAEHVNGRNKIDYSGTGKEGRHPAMMEILKEHKPNYTFLHYNNPDGAGHSRGYLGDRYRSAVKKVDSYLGELLEMVDSDSDWKNDTVIVLTADHGGKPGTRNHVDADHPYNYTIPFIVWGKGVAKGKDLYKINAKTRSNPGEGRPKYGYADQPIRNGDSGNLALYLLGLPSVPGSFINSSQDLNVR